MARVQPFQMLFTLILFCLFYGGSASPSHAETYKAIFSDIDFVALRDDDAADDECAIYRAHTRGGGGYLSIVIDDMGLSGYSRGIVGLGLPLTLSYLPYAKDLNKQVTEARKSGHHVMLHMPMQPIAKNIIEPYMIMADEADEESLQKLDEALSRMPDVEGFNNHMGSKVTSDPDKMRLILTEIKQRGLFFMDSKTIAASVAGDMAHDMGIKTIARDIFLDDANDDKRPIYRLYQSARKAKEKGVAVAIGHPLKETYHDMRRFITVMDRDKALANVGLISITEAIKVKECLNKKQPMTSAALLTSTERHYNWTQDMLDVFVAGYYEEDQ